MNAKQVKAVTKFIAMFEKVHVLEKKNHEIKKLQITEKDWSVQIVIQAGKIGEERGRKFITSIVGVDHTGGVIGFDKDFRRLHGCFDNLWQQGFKEKRFEDKKHYMN